MAKTKNTPKLFYSNPIHDPTFSDLQNHWYKRLKKSGFEDAENVAHEDRPLKRWSGISSLYVEVFQPAGRKLISSFPDSVHKEEEEFQNHPEFKELCVRICGHGNSKLTPYRVRGIWQDYCDGRTIRQSEVRYHVSDTTVFRVIQTITEWMRLMESRPEKLSPEIAVIIARVFNHEMDSRVIYATWRNALWFSEKRDERHASEFYYLATQEIKKTLLNPEVSVRIACAQDDPNFIAGYAVMKDAHLEFVYVKVDYRKKGIAKLLTKGCKTVSQPQTKIGKAIVESHHLEVKENSHGRKEETREENDS